MRFLFVHGNRHFSLAEWCLREAVSASLPGPEAFAALEVTHDDLEAQELLRRTVAAARPDLVGFSCHAWSTSVFAEAASWVKHLCPESRVVLGGPQVASAQAAEAVLTRWRDVDLVVRGPGEPALRRLLAGGSGGGALDDVPGLSCRSGGSVRHNRASSVRGWSRGPIFHRANREVARRLEGLPQASYETLRGCPHRCLYCVYPGDGVALLDDELVREELDFICSFRIPHLRICDAQFGGTQRRAKGLLRHLARVNRGTSVKVYPALEHVDSEYVSLLGDAGAEVTSIGVQSTNPRALQAIRRRPSHDRADAIRLLLERFGEAPADLIVGLPGDDVAGLERSIQDVLDLGFRRINTFRLTVFPGTGLAEEVTTHMEGGPVTRTSSGQILSSPRFPVEHQRGVAVLTHAAAVAAPLRRTREVVARRGTTDWLSRLARGLSPDSLVLLSRLFERGGTAELLQRLPEVLDHLRPVAGEAVEVRDAVLEDLVRLLWQRCRQARQRGILWPGGRSTELIRTVVVKLGQGDHLVWDLAAGSLGRESDGRQVDATSGPHCRKLDPLLELGAAKRARRDP